MNEVGVWAWFFKNQKNINKTEDTRAAPVVTDAMVKAAHWVLLEETLSDEIIRSALTAALAQMK